MATKKRTATQAKSGGAEEDPEARTATAEGEDYEQAVATFTASVERMRKGDYAEAKQGFEQLTKSLVDEHLLLDRAETYARICDRRLAEPRAEPANADERYYEAVLRMNDGRLDEAIGLLDAAIEETPTSASAYYTRACARALKGQGAEAIVDLRQAIAIDPKVRFQAVNDSDFEAIREEPAYIDLVEPARSGS